jgi:hypothetical protein
MELHYPMNTNGMYTLSKLRGDFDDIASDILREHQPLTLIQPMPLNLDALIKERLGLTVDEKTISASDPAVLGAMIFGRTNAATDRTRSLINAGIILLDTSLNGDGQTGRKRFTYAHEAAHWLLHKAYHARRMKRLGDRVGWSFAYCRSENISNPGRPYDDYTWQEWQANALASAMLMPKATFDAAVSRIFRTDNSSYKYCISGRNGNLYAVSEKIAEIYNVSRTAAMLRLSELGYVRSVDIYCDESEAFD